MSNKHTITVNDREFHTILTALRYWQQHYPLDRCDAFYPLSNIATNGGNVEALSNDEIDTLCEEMNCGERDGADDKARRLLEAILPYAHSHAEDWRSGLEDVISGLIDYWAACLRDGD